MAYSDFTLADLRHRFGLTVTEGGNLFAAVPEVELPPGLANTLARYLPLALNLNTEKARSELLIAPVLVELKLLYPDQLSVFSGIEFTVDAAVGLSGRCDYILAHSPQQLALTAPVCVLVEAKSENIVGGVPQCLAAMVAAQRFNLAEGSSGGPVYGAVTTGVLWRFLILDGLRARVDGVEYPIQTPRRVFGVLRHIALGRDAEQVN
jgi:hypothetical protein